MPNFLLNLLLMLIKSVEALGTFSHVVISCSASPQINRGGILGYTIIGGELMYNTYLHQIAVKKTTYSVDGTFWLKRLYTSSWYIPIKFNRISESF